MSRAGPVSCSSASRMTRGRKGSSLIDSAPTGEPSHRTSPSEESARSPLATLRKALRTVFEFRRKRLLRCRPNGLGLLALGRLVGREAEPLQFTDVVTLDQHFARRAYFCFQHFVLSETPHEHGCPAVYEPFRQSLMQRIRQSVFDIARFFLPMCRIGQPSGPMRDISPCSDLGDALRERVDIALDGIGTPHLFGQIVLVEMALAGQIEEEGSDEIGMLSRRDAAIVR